MTTTAIHATLTGIELHYSKLQIITGAPSSIPTYRGQTQYDETNNILYIATGVSSLADWKAQSSTPNVIETSSATYTATEADNGAIIAMTNSALRTFNLPPNPINGFFIGVQDSAATGAYTNTITVNSGGNLITGGGTTYKISSNNACVLFVFDFASSTWIISSSYIGLQPTLQKIRGADGADALNITSTNFEVLKTLLLDDVTDSTKQLTISLSGATTGTKTTLIASQTANRSLTLPDITDTLVTKNTTDIFTNKSFNSATTLLAANQLRFNNAANTFYTSIIGGNNTSNLSLTLPISAPAAGQILYSIDTIGTLGWTNSTTLANVAANDSNVTFTISDNRFQNCSPTADRTYTMPSTGLAAGDTWTFYNRSNSMITLVAANGSRISQCFPGGETVIQSISANPGFSSNWRTILSASSGTFNYSTTGIGVFAAGVSLQMSYTQQNERIVIAGLAQSSGSPSAASSGGFGITLPFTNTVINAYGTATPDENSIGGAFVGGGMTFTGAASVFYKFSSSITTFSGFFNGIIYLQ